MIKSKDDHLFRPFVCWAAISVAGVLIAIPLRLASPIFSWEWLLGLLLLTPALTLAIFLTIAAIAIIDFVLKS